MFEEGFVDHNRPQKQQQQETNSSNELKTVHKIMLPPVTALFFAAAAVSTTTTTTTTMAPAIKLTYFNIEAAAEPTRLALTVAGIPFEDNRIAFPDWPELKKTTPFGQLPVMEIDGGSMIAQSGAMLRYVATLSEDKFLCPPEKMLAVEEALGVTDDLNRAFQPGLTMGMNPSAFGYEKDSNKSDEGKARTAAIRTTFVKDELPKYLGFYEKLLERSGGDWLVAGEKPTIADCHAVPNLRRFSRGFIDAVPADCLNTHPKVVAYLERFCALPEIAGRYEDTGIGGTSSK